VTDSDCRVTPFGDDSNRNHERSVPMDVGGRKQECTGHRQIEHARNLNLADMQRRPWWHNAEEPARERAPRDAEEKVSDTPEDEQGSQQS